MTTLRPADGAGIVREFAMDLIRDDAGGSGNSVTSPWSIVAALTMARLGAAGETAREIDHVLHAQGQTDLAAAIRGYASHLSGLAGPTHNDSGGEGEVLIRNANSVWLQEGYPLEPGFVAQLSDQFGAPPQTVDFTRSSDSAAEQINQWVVHQTAGRIAHLLSPDSIGELTRLVLTNAAHMLAPWARSFRADETLPFRRLDGSTTPVELMGVQATMPFRQQPGWTSVTIPYAGRGLALTVVLPAEGRFGAVELRPTIVEWLNTEPDEHRPVHLRMPRFDVSVSVDLQPILARLGMPLAFNPDWADFSAMSRAEQLFIGAVAHQATITVDEEGTEAAAATAVAIAGRAAFNKPPPPLEISVDRPFLFVLHDIAFGAPIFVGRVVDPA